MSQFPPPPIQPGPLQGPLEAPGATTGMVLGIISIVVSAPILGFILAFIGFKKSKEAKEACARNPGMYSNAGVAQAGYILSIIGMVLGGISSLCMCGYFIMIALAIAGGVASGGNHP